MFIVVLSTLVVSTIVAQGPIIFLSLAQAESGEMDVWYAATTADNYKLNDLRDLRNFFNYTQITDLYGDSYNLAPRF